MSENQDEFDLNPMLARTLIDYHKELGFFTILILNLRILFKI